MSRKAEQKWSRSGVIRFYFFFDSTMVIPRVERPDGFDDDMPIGPSITKGRHAGSLSR